MKYNKFYISILLTLLAGTICRAQNNYVQQDNVTVAGVTSSAQLYSLPVGQRQTVRSYYDGFGRPVQTVAVQASVNNNNDIVQPIQYDNLGRQTKQYLPYVGTDGTGSYHSNAPTEQLAYYSSAYGDSSPFSAQIFDNSPLQRLLGSGSVGDGFQPVSGQHYKTVSYRNNTAADNVIIFSATGTYAVGAYYAANLLTVTDGKDEDGIETIAFNDMLGRTILKRQVTGNVSAPYLDTYYIYNSSGWMAFIVTPKGTSTIIASPTALLFSSSPLKSLIYSYVYDTQGRLIQKTVPVSGTISIIYDPMNRPILVQDANMRVGKNWRYIKYDVKGRAISQGIYNDLTYTNPASMQTYVTGLASTYSTAWYESRTGSSTNKYYTNSVFPTTNITPLAFGFYDDYDLYQTGSVAYNYLGQGLANEENQTSAAVKGMPTMVLKRTVGPGLANIWLMTVMFYDKRGNLIQTQSNNQLNYTTEENTTDTKTIVPDFVGRPQQGLVIKVTGTGTAGTNKVLTTYNYDNHNTRLLSVSQQYNSQASVTISAYAYNELGQLITKNLGQTATGAIPATQILNTTYSGTNVVTATSSITMSTGFSVPSGSTFSAFISNGYLQTLNYAYNIRGQLLSMNSSQLTGAYTSSVFGMQLLYDTQDSNVGNAPSYDGKISAIKWMTKDNSGTNSNERSYKYSYDNLNRLTSSAYAERTAGTGSFSTNTDAYTENGITYDENGNLKTLARNSVVSGAVTPVDNLSYTYAATNPDSLLNMTDGTGANYTGVGFRNLTGSTANYTYDLDGNLLTDPYKGLAIGYDVLNKTEKITITTATNRWIDYSYDGDGNVIRKRTYDNNILQTTTDYIGGMVYTNNTLAYFPIPEGRVVNNTGTLTPEYVITDQQGNARVGFNNTGTGGTTKVVQENSYTGFGLVLANSAVSGGSNKKLYNGGSEWQNDYNNQPDYYQTFYRNYDAAIGRFVGTDPQPESSESMTPYQYAGNNPVMMKDPMGNYPVRKRGLSEGSFYSGSGGLGEPGGGNGLESGDDSFDAQILYEAQQGDVAALNYFAAVHGGVSVYNAGDGTSNSPASGMNYAQLSYLITGQADNDYMMNHYSGHVLNFSEDGGLLHDSANDPYAEKGVIAYQDGTTITSWEAVDNLLGQSIEGIQGAENGEWTHTANNFIGSFGMGWGVKDNAFDYAIERGAELAPALLKYAKGVKLVSKGLFAAQIVVSGAQTIDAWRNSDRNWRTNDGNKWGVTGKAGVDILMGGVATFGGPLGWGVAGIYFIGDAAGWWGDWGEAPKK